MKSWFSKPLDNSNQNLFSYPLSHCNFLYFPLGFLNKKMARKPKAQFHVAMKFFGTKYSNLKKIKTTNLLNLEKRW